MQTILFSFRSETPPTQQNEIVDQITRWRGVNKVARFDPGASESDYSLVWVVYVEDNAEVDQLVARLLAHPAIEEAEQPTSRHL